MQPTSIRSPATGRLIFLCFLVAVFEGVDIQAMGVAAPGLAAAFRLTPAQMGEVMSASTVGLMLGAAAGGWLSDRIGRARVIVIAMAVLSVFSFATVAAPGYVGLRIIRVLAGLGLGGAFPNLIAIVAEHSPSSNRTASLAWMYIGLPVGGVAAGLVASWTTAGDWHPVFYVGGLGPLLLVPLLLAGLPPSNPQHGAPARARLPRATAAGIRLLRSALGVTARLWVSYFFTLLVVYLLLNWLPSLMMSAGYSHLQATISSIILNAGAVLGSLALGALTDRVRAAQLPGRDLSWNGRIASRAGSGPRRRSLCRSIPRRILRDRGSADSLRDGPRALPGKRARNRRRRGGSRRAIGIDLRSAAGGSVAEPWISAGYRPTHRGPGTVGRLHRGPQLGWAARNEDCQLRVRRFGSLRRL